MDKFVKPETDLLSLVMLAKARDQGLDIVFVDEERFFDGSFKRIKGELLNGTGPFDGAWYIEFDLAPVLLHSKTFILNDHSESMGYGVTIGYANLVNELIKHFVTDAGKVDYGDWQAEQVRTIEQLTGYINRMLTIEQPKTSWTERLPSAPDVLVSVAIAFTVVGIGIYSGFKFIKHLYDSVFEESNDRQ